jgi:hypothetical protein
MSKLGRIEQKNIQFENPEEGKGLISNLTSTTELAAYLTATASINNLVNLLSRQVLDTCQDSYLINNTMLHGDLCKSPHELSLYYGALSAGLFTTSLALPYLPLVIDKIKKLRVMGEDIKEPQAPKKPIKIERVDPSLMLRFSIILTGVFEASSSLFYLSDSGLRTALGTCSNQYQIDEYTIQDFTCQNMHQEGVTRAVAALMLFTTASIIANAPSLTGRIKSFFAPATTA